MPDTQISEEMCLAAAKSDYAFDGRGDWDKASRIDRERYCARSKKGLEAAISGYAIVPREPTRGLLISMAVRMDHAFCAPAQEIAGTSIGYTDGYREVVLADLAKAYEEITGAGFYAPEREDLYRAMTQAAPPVQGRMERG